MEELIFKDRHDAGIQLAAALTRRNYGPRDTVVFGIPRGGIIVADEVARCLSAPLDILVARKLRAPNQPDLGIGAVTLGEGNYFINEELAHVVGATPDYLDREISFQLREIERRFQTYRRNHPQVDLSEKTAIVVDDGIATGYTFRAALQWLILRRPARLIAAAPVATPKSLELLHPVTDDILSLSLSEYFVSVSTWYNRYEDVSDDEIVAILDRNWKEHPP
jgi:putative phosphoribosyl transferase